MAGCPCLALCCKCSSSSSPGHSTIRHSALRHQLVVVMGHLSVVLSALHSWYQRLHISACISRLGLKSPGNRHQVLDIILGGTIHWPCCYYLALSLLRCQTCLSIPLVSIVAPDPLNCCQSCTLDAYPRRPFCGIDTSQFCPDGGSALTEAQPRLMTFP